MNISEKRRRKNKKIVDAYATPDWTRTIQYSADGAAYDSQGWSGFGRNPWFVTKGSRALKARLRFNDPTTTAQSRIYRSSQTLALVD